ncbi:unnamed protein product [Prorocentrum cordatum]|uniref:Uncharacterized protein n=1 Tax=Prorocentrum cordatum TaxID=2364126 RepID=A0ABN9PLF0_9DINO|nr:unnamed protein product [Polarella glacialis]
MSLEVCRVVASALRRSLLNAKNHLRCWAPTSLAMAMEPLFLSLFLSAGHLTKLEGVVNASLVLARSSQHLPTLIPGRGANETCRAAPGSPGAHRPCSPPMGSRALSAHSAAEHGGGGGRTPKGTSGRRGPRGLRAARGLQTEAVKQRRLKLMADSQVWKQWAQHREAPDLQTQLPPARPTAIRLRPTSNKGFRAKVRAGIKWQKEMADLLNGYLDNIAGAFKERTPTVLCGRWRRRRSANPALADPRCKRGDGRRG